MKILWLCNAPLSDSKIKTTGSWLQPMAEMLNEQNNVELVIVSQQKRLISVVENRINGIHQYILPQKGAKNYGQIPSDKSIGYVRNILRKERPDIVHVWGTEQMWAYMNVEGCFDDIPVLLEIQGLLYAYVPYYYGGLTLKEQLQSIHFKELIMPWRTLFGKKHSFRKRGESEKRAICSFRHIGCTTQWVENHIKTIHPGATIHKSKIMLRNKFYQDLKWEYKFSGGHPIVYTMCSDAISYKGLHVLLKALDIVKKRFPDVELRIAGNMKVGNLYLDGYSIFIENLIKHYSLQENVTFLGPINEDSIVDELSKADVGVVPSFVETYCLALAEMMIAGLPTVVSYTSGMADLVTDKTEVLFYNPIDHVTCASHIVKLITDRELATSLSVNGKKKRLLLSNKADVVNRQMEIYERVIQDK